MEVGQDRQTARDKLMRKVRAENYRNFFTFNSVNNFQIFSAVLPNLSIVIQPNLSLILLLNLNLNLLPNLSLVLLPQFELSSTARFELSSTFEFGSTDPV